MSYPPVHWIWRDDPRGANQPALMRIWIVNHYAVPPNRAGGARHYTLAKQLQARGHQVLIIAASFDHRTRSEFRLASSDAYRTETIEGVPYHWVKAPAYEGNSPARLWNMVSFAARSALRPGLREGPAPDVVLGSSPTLFAALAAEKIARSFGVPFVLEVRDLWPDSLIDLGSVSARHPFIRILRRIEGHLYRSADRVVSLLPGAVDHITRIRGRDGVVWIPNGVDLSGVEAVVPAPLSADDPLKVVYAGAHGLANGLDTILEAAAIAGQQVRVLLVGDGPEKTRLELRARKLGLDNVEFREPVPRALILDLLRRSDACIMPLKDSPVFRWGVSPNKLFDYLAAARPVIFGVQSPYNPVSMAEAGVTVQPEDPEALAAAMVQLRRLSNGERCEMGLRGFRYVQENHNAVVLAERLESVLNDVC